MKRFFVLAAGIPILRNPQSPMPSFFSQVADYFLVPGSIGI